MSYTRVLQAPGQWSLTLSETTPQSVLDSIALYDHIVILPAPLNPVAGFTSGDIMRLAKEGGYTGVITSRDTPWELAGADPSWWLGDENDVGPILTSRVQRSSAATLSTWLGDILPSNGISTGTVTNTGTSWAGNLPKGMSVRKALNKVCRKTGAQWRMRSDGTIDAAAPGTLFRLTPTVVITRNPVGTQSGYRQVNGTTLVKSRDAEDVASDVWVVARNDAGGLDVEATATVVPSGVRWKTLTNGTPSRYKVIDSPNETAAEAVLLASDTLEDLRAARTDLEISSDTFNVGAYVTPGDRVYVYDLDAGIYDTSNQLNWLGEVICPQLMKVRSLTCPVERGLGVYLRTSGATPSYIDLTPYVEWETGETTWEVSSVGGANTFTRRSVQTPGNKSGLTDNDLMVNRNAERDCDTAWVPSWTNLAVGTGGSASNTGKWWYSNGFLTLAGTAVLGTSSASVSGAIQLALPSGFTIAVGTNNMTPFGLCIFTDTGTANYSGVVVRLSTTSLEMKALPAGGTYVTNTATSATVPFTWGAGDQVNFTVTVPVTRSI